MSITKSVAGMIYGNNYKLIDKYNNRIFEIERMDDISFTIFCEKTDESVITYFHEIGSTFLIICRPWSHLEKNIDDLGEPCGFWDSISIKYESELRNMAKNDYWDGFLPDFICKTLASLHFPMELSKNLIHLTEI